MIFARVARAPELWHGRAMQTMSRSGGCFLTIAILGGFLVGLAINQPMNGVLCGTLAGIVLALVVWLVDRRRSG